MKVTLDLSELLAHGKITQAEHDKLASFAAEGTSSLAVNVLIGFGVVAVTVGAVAMVPTPATAIVIGAGLFAASFAVARAPQWSILAQIFVVIGALMFSGGVLAVTEGSLSSMMMVTLALAAGAVVARSSLLAAFAMLALGACFGARAGYWHATYALAIYEPAVTVVVFAALALATFNASKRLPHEYERVAITAARTSVFMVNFGFWIGSLWGDRLLLVRSLIRNDQSILTDYTDRTAIIPDWAFSIGWAVAIVAVGAWGARANRRWVVNVAAVFGAIHFYTQWFERLGATPAAILLAGILMLAFALVLWRYNRRAVPQPVS